MRKSATESLAQQASSAGQNNLYVQVMQEILFKLSGAVAVDKGVGQRARYKAGV
ncbi:Uncharacterised protein [Escherichia coli]|nr:Uncharacterised protein [Escherichia coli]CAD6110444.1 Uncharacterised protein [Escherichia coli]